MSVLVWCDDCGQRHRCGDEHGPDGHGGSSICCPRKKARSVETTLPPMLTPELARSLRTAGRNVTKWTAERDRLVKEAVAAGASLREVGEAAGISHTAVKFIAHGRPS